VLAGVGAIGVLAAASAGVGRLLLERVKVAAAGRHEVVLPAVRRPLPEPGPGTSFEIPGLEPIVTSNDDFYQIDTALRTPRIDLENWTLRITGMVDRPLQFGYSELLGMQLVERYVTLACVSNRIGGDLISNAKWLGVPLTDVLTRAGIEEDATQIVGRSVDRFTVGFPTEAAFDGREALVAVGMNGEPLPFRHGFPARLVVSGLYGYVSATKWLDEIELTRWDAFDAYWIPRGWSKEGPIKTQSRIDLPKFDDRLAAGPQQVAGIAWAQNRGITKVEVQIDEEPWQEADVSEPLSKDTWVQWAHAWHASPGEHFLRVRATDATGLTQSGVFRPPRPDGSEGYHTIRVQVV
jgi:DMSO/TMAO reductase YedYZ molybdopterin-dependent catalytic subunit